MKRRVKKGYSHLDSRKEDLELPGRSKRKIMARRRERVKMNKLRVYDPEDLEDEDFED
jgi:hypothetical protein